MSLEDRIRSATDQAVGTLVQHLLDAFAEERERFAAERDAAVRQARAAAFEEAERAGQARVADAEARVRATLDDKIAQARAEDREAAAGEIRRQLEAEVEAKMRDAIEAAEQRMRVALADGEARAVEDLKASVAAARVKEREIEMAGVTRLLESIRGLDGATTLSEVLDALALASAREAARAALVVLRNERIQGWRLSGFGSRDAQPKSIDLTVAEAGVIGTAITTARTVTTRDNQTAAAGPGFETLPSDRMGLAVPVVVGGRVVAVVYADAVAMDGHQRHVPSSWPELIEILARHAGRCLEALTTQKTTSSRPASGSGVTSGSTTHSTGSSALPAGPSATRQITDGVSDPIRLLQPDVRLLAEPVGQLTS